LLCICSLLLVLLHFETTFCYEVAVVVFLNLLLLIHVDTHVKVARILVTLLTLLFLVRVDIFKQSLEIVSIHNTFPLFDIQETLARPRINSTAVKYWFHHVTIEDNAHLGCEWMLLAEQAAGSRKGVCR